MNDVEAQALLERVAADQGGAQVTAYPYRGNERVLYVVVLTRTYAGPYFFRTVTDYDDYLAARATDVRLLTPPA